MTDVRQAALAVGVGLLLCAQAAAEILPSWPVGHAVLESDLIIEGRMKGHRAVAITRVYAGSAKVGDKITVDKLTTLPSVAYEKFKRGRPRSEKGTPTKGATVVLFLKRDKRTSVYRPLASGSGVKWLLNQKVYGYQQLANPGGYQLVPDAKVSTLGKLRIVIADALKKRKKFRDAAGETDPAAKAGKLSRYIQPDQPYYYFLKAVEILQTLGRDGALVLTRESSRPEQEKRRRAFIIAIGRTKDRASVPVLTSIMDKAKPIVLDTVGVFDWSKASEKERRAMSDWQVAVFAAAEIGGAEAMAHFREAAVWGAEHGQQQLLEHAVRGMRQAPTESNLRTFEKIFAALPREADGFGKHAAYRTLLSLIAHKFRDAVPILASQLDHPDNYNQRQAHRGLRELVGEDLGTEKKPWLEWYSRSSPPANDR